MLGIEQFLKYLRLERNYSDQTIVSYREDLELFLLFFKKKDVQLSWETIDADVVRDWVEYMMDKGNSATSVNRRLSALRSFYRYALKRKLIERNPIYNVKGPKRQKTLPQFLKEAEMDKLIDPDMWTDDYNNVLARTIIITFYSTGIRLSELVSLEDKDINAFTNELKVTGKRDKQRIIPFGAELAETLELYKQKRDEEVDRMEKGLFLNKKGKRVSNAYVRKLVKENLARVSTLKKKSPHVLRHTFATAMLNAEAGLGSVKELLGHESISTTEVYTHTTFEQLKKVYKDAHPRA
ncbi:tyrosine recombinase XerC [Prevotella ihumii]|uniref:tyrosine recombinase XerC n=1 Tax=Prevotella ihumii TaxID=1917878 RepID=UPI00098176FB|nr:tyrosine recombinase XerC [Prevotella ihumii]